MLHVRLCTIQRENTEEAFGFELWRSKRRSSNSTTPTEHDESSDLLIVKSVYPGSPAEKGDLRENDKIIAVDGTNVRDAKSVRDLLAKAALVRVMVERWEGPPVQHVDRKASTPIAPQRSTRTPAPSSESGRRRANTLRSVLDRAAPNVDPWPRNYGLAQSYASLGGSRARNSPSATGRPVVLHAQDASGSNNQDGTDESEAPRQSILDVFPEARALLNIAGRGFYSDDLRGD